MLVLRSLKPAHEVGWDSDIESRKRLLSGSVKCKVIDSWNQHRVTEVPYAGVEITVANLQASWDSDIEKP